jgi:hypothetical protein
MVLPPRLVDFKGSEVKVLNGVIWIYVHSKFLNCRAKPKENKSMIFFFKVRNFLGAVMVITHPMR